MKKLLFAILIVIVGCHKNEVRQTYPNDVELFNAERDAIAAKRPPKPPKGQPVDTATKTACIYLDFDGEQVSGIWGNFYAYPSGMTYDQQQQVLSIVKIRWAGFSVKVTDSLSVFLSYPISKRMQVIETANSSLYPGSGGVAYIGSYLWADGTPSFVFPDRYGNNVNWVAYASTHEPGHMIGLRHQSVYDESCNYLSEYRPGWNMGVYNGQTFIWGVGCVQDDNAVINSNL